MNILELTPLVSAVVVIGSFFAFTLIGLEVLRSRRNQRLRNAVMNKVIHSLDISFSLIVECKHSPEQIVPLLLHLSEYDRAKIQVVIIAHPRTIPFLERQQRKYRDNLKLSLIKQTSQPGVTARLRRQITGDIVLTLNPTDRLGKDFFRRVALEFLDVQVQAVSARRAVLLGNELKSAVRAWNAVVLDMLYSLGIARRNAQLYRRDAYFEGVGRREVVYSARATIFSSAADYRDARLAGATLLIGTMSIGALGYTWLPYTWPILLLSWIVGAVMLFGLYLASFPYSKIHQTTMMAFFPFWPILSLLGIRTKAK